MKYLLLFFGVICSLKLNAQSNNCHPKIKKKYHFKLIKKWGISIDTNLFRIDGVYISSNADSSKFKFTRYFKNGKIFFSKIYEHLPDSNDLQNLEEGEIGEYFVKDSFLVVEAFEPFTRYFHLYCLYRNGKVVVCEKLKRNYRFKSKQISDILYHQFTDNRNFFRCRLRHLPTWWNK